MALTTYTGKNVTNTKTFNSAITTVFSGIAGRNDQVQQLLLVAVNEAAKVSGGQVTNNLDWLTGLLNKAEQTNGINLNKLVKYVREVLCCNTISYNPEKKAISKKQDKNIKLSYNLTPDCTWFDYGKKATVQAAFDYGKRVTSAVNSAMLEGKGGLTLIEVMQAVMNGNDITIADLMNAMEAVNPMKEDA